MKTVLGLFLGLVSLSAMATEEIDIFELKKTLNPKNVLHYEAYIEDCKLVEPYVSAYWVMGEENNQTKGLNFILRPTLGPRIQESDQNRVRFTLGALDKVSIAGSDKMIQVELDNKCKPKATIVYEGQNIELKEINADLSGLSCNSITIKGIGQDGKEFKKTIQNR